jgi:hypothetical protein
MPTIHFTDQEFENLLTLYAAKIDVAQKYIDKVNPILSRLKRVQKQQVEQPEPLTRDIAKAEIEPAKKHGRPKNVKIEIINREVLVKAGNKRRGRPPKIKVEEPKPTVTGDGTKELIFQKNVSPDVQPEIPAKKRGRPPRVKPEAPIVAAAPKPRRKRRHYGYRKSGRIHLANLWKPLPKK